MDDEIDPGPKLELRLKLCEYDLDLSGAIEKDAEGAAKDEDGPDIPKLELKL